MIAVGFHFLARKDRQGVPDVGGDEDVVRGSGQEGGLDRNGPVRCLQLPGGQVPPLFQQPFRIVYEQIDIGDKPVVRQGRPGRDPALHIQDEHGTDAPVFPVPTITSYHQA